MKYIWAFVAYFIIQSANAQTLTVEGVKVSVSADSAAVAREQALDQAHHLAFEKLVRESFPERQRSVPSEETLRSMVHDFSIDREKTTPTSYTASLTFQFDEPQIRNWLEQVQNDQPDHQDSPSSPFLHQPKEESKPLFIAASYGTHSEWQHIKKTLEAFPGVQKLSIFTLSPKNAKMEIIYRGSTDKLVQGLLEQNLRLLQQDGEWVLSSNEQALR